jgi:uncharacterized membrane protein
MKILLRLFGYAVGFAALVLTEALAQSPEIPEIPTIQLLGTFDYPGTGNLTRPQKINDVGDVVGIFVDASGASRGFVKFSNGNFSAPLVDPNDAGNLTEGRGINGARLVCGDYRDSAGTFEGFFFQNNLFTNYAPESTFTVALGVNNAGDFCGSEIPSSTGIQSGFLNIGGALTDFVVTGATATLAYSLNSSNQSCGYYIDSSGVTHGFWLDSDGTMHAPIDPAGSTGTFLFGNTVLRHSLYRRHDVNVMVGRYTDAAGRTHGILFDPQQGFVAYDYPGATFTSLNGINERGVVVGRYTDPSTGIDHGILAKVQRGAAAGVMLPLAPPSGPAQASPERAVIVEPAY